MRCNRLRLEYPYYSLNRQKYAISIKFLACLDTNQPVWVHYTYSDTSIAAADEENCPER